mgnify:CR=1 FL=1
MASRAEVDRAIGIHDDRGRATVQFTQDSEQCHCAADSAVKIILIRNGDDFPTEGVQTLEPEELIQTDSSE